MRSFLDNGSDWPFAELDAASKATDLAEALEFGNHKGATNNTELLEKLVSKDVIYDYSLPVPLTKLSCIPGALMVPMNIMKQNTIDEQGRVVERDRPIHNQSYLWSSGTSVNSRVDKELLLPCMFGGCIRRLTNWAVAAIKKIPKHQNPVFKI